MPKKVSKKSPVKRKTTVRRKSPVRRKTTVRRKPATKKKSKLTTVAERRQLYALLKSNPPCSESTRIRLMKARNNFRFMEARNHFIRRQARVISRDDIMKELGITATVNSIADEMVYVLYNGGPYDGEIYARVNSRNYLAHDAIPIIQFQYGILNKKVPSDEKAFQEAMNLVSIVLTNLKK